jgi:hypothetical protein
MTSPSDLDELDLLDHVFDHLCEEQPEAVADLKDGEIRRRCKLGIGRARKHGLTDPPAITAFASLMFLVSPQFDQHPAIAAALQEKDMKLLFRRTKEKDWEEAGALGEGWPE